MLFISSGLFALASAQAAMAQDAAAIEDEASVIVVTAQKRAQNIEDVPISISVVDGETLLAQGASSLTDYAALVPGMQAVNSGTPGQTQITLRGVAPLSSAQTVGIYLNDAPVGASSIYSRAGLFSLDLLPYDIQRVEVLRGPQGTLYGASSIGGLLKYVTVAPSTKTLSMRAGIEGFSIDGAGGLGWAAQTMVNAPLIEGKLGISASFSWRSTPGWVDSVNNPALDDQNAYEQLGGRVAMLWRATNDLSVKLSSIWQSIDAQGNGMYAENLTGTRLANGRSFNNFLAEPYQFDLEHYAAAIDYDLGGAALTSVTTYSEAHSTRVTDASYQYGTLFPLLTGGAIAPGLTPFTIDLGLKKFTQELRVASPSGGSVEWLVGGFYTHEDSTNAQLVRAFDKAGQALALFDPLAVIALPAVYEEYAVFANGTLRVGGGFEVTGGLRWARNEQTFSQSTKGIIVAPAERSGESAEDVLTFSISSQFRFSDAAMVYARVANGYRPGGPNVSAPGLPSSVNSDKLTNYEVGLKADLAGRLASIDVAIFYMDWDDIQVVRSFGGISGQANGGKAVSKGFEGSLLVRPAVGLTFTGTGSYTDATLSESVPEINGLKDDRLPAVPEFSAMLRFDYAFDLGADASAAVGAGVRHASSRLSRVESDPLAARARPYTSVDLNASVTFADHWTMRAYARNLLNDDGEMARSLLADGLNRPSFFGIVPLQPRTVGVALDLAF
ncbi:TonB-dependent receptor [Sphingomonas sp. 37zxx]|uniref:TonB-dependent receptor n=1 Tax=Sphingomonas sp. 37zxx TaxID=1550073 RepID=UPI00053BF0A3|nr:TonB-dependent receptor [Sphingomonas sp. 37zxx]